MVFEKADTWTFEAPGAPEILASCWEFWAKRGYDLRSTSASSFQGRSFHSTLGIHRVVEIMTVPSGSGAIIQFRYRADVRADVAAGGAVVAVLLLPVAVVGAALSWHEYETDWSRERWDFWNFLLSTGRAKPAAASLPQHPAPLPETAAPPSSMPGAPTTGGTPAPRRPEVCAKCGAAVVGQGRFCSSCGAAIPSS